MLAGVCSCNLKALASHLAFHATDVCAQAFAGAMADVLRALDDAIDALWVRPPHTHAPQVDRFAGCFLGRAECSDTDPCALHDRWADLRDRYLAILSETPLADLLETGRDAVDLSADPGSARRAARNPTGNPKPV